MTRDGLFSKKIFFYSVDNFQTLFDNLLLIFYLIDEFIRYQNQVIDIDFCIRYDVFVCGK